MEYGLVDGFIDHLHVVTINDYSTVADFHPTSHFTRSSQPAFTSRYLETSPTMAVPLHCIH
jgi:hypothetical protein